MTLLTLILTGVGTVVIVIGLYLSGKQIRAWGTGTFQKGQVEMWRQAYEDEKQLRTDAEAQTRKDMQDLRDLVTTLQGELNSYRTEYAKIIAVEVVKALRADGWSQGTGKTA